jgi:hypothetical protein
MQWRRAFVKMAGPRGAMFILLLVAATVASAATPPNRVASISVSEDFLNEQITAHNRSALLKNVKINLDPDNGNIYVRGQIQIPTEELRAVNLEPRLGRFHFQLTIRPEVSSEGHLILNFPLNETYFYPADAKNNPHERVIIPVQLLSLALASARGYLAALSGDFSTFDRKEAKYKALIKGLNKLIAAETNADAKADFKDERDALRLQLQAVPIEKRQMQDIAHSLSSVLAFTGEKELNLNSEIGALKNALVLKIRLSQLVPYLHNVQLGGIRFRHDKKDGKGEDYLSIDANSELVVQEPVHDEKATPHAPRDGMKIAPAIIIRLNESLMESTSVVNAEKKAMGDKLRDFKVELKEDGMHVHGKYHKFFFNIPFATTVDFVMIEPDVFEARVRDLHLAGFDVDFLSSVVLESIKAKLETMLKGLCEFEYVGEQKDHSRALRVTVDSDKLVPAFSELYLVDVDVRDHQFLLKVGHIKE